MVSKCKPLFHLNSQGMINTFLAKWGKLMLLKSLVISGNDLFLNSNIKKYE